MVRRRFHLLLAPLLVSLGLIWLACEDLTVPLSVSISVTPQHDTLYSLGDALQLRADAVYSNGDPASGVRWISLSGSVVAVDRTGMAVAISKGEAKIEVSVADVADTTTLVVLAAQGLPYGLPTTLSGSADSKQFFKFTVPTASSSLSTAPQAEPGVDSKVATSALASRLLKISTAGGTGDVSLSVRYGDVPTDSDSDCESTQPGNDESCEFADPMAGDWYVLVDGAIAFQGVTLTAQLGTPPPQHVLAVEAAGTGNGSVISDPVGIDCAIAAGTESGDCSESYDEDTQVTLAAQPVAGSTFEGWSGGGCSGVGVCQVMMSQAQTVTASFDLTPIPQFPLTVSGAGTGNGDVTSNPSGINCTIAGGGETGDCSELYDEDTQVTLTAQAAAGSTFEGWSGSGCSGTGVCQVTVDRTRDVTATFRIIPQYELNVVGSGTGSGGVTSTPSGIACTITAGTATGDCSDSYAENTQVSLTASADEGSTFQGWSGAGCSGTGPCQVTMSQAQTVTAAFEPTPNPQHVLSVQGVGPGNGGVTSNPSGINCTITGATESGDCSQTYDENTQVTLTAQADAGSTFQGWSGGGCSGTGSCQVTMSQAVTVTATFDLIPRYTLTVVGTGTGGGNVTSNPSGISCTITAGAEAGDCSELFDEGTQVTLTAATGAGSTFTGWSGGGCIGSGPCQVTMNLSQTVTAIFELAPDPLHILTVLGDGTGNGGVTSSPSGISCTMTAGAEAGDCSEPYIEGTPVTLTAQPDPGSAHTGWSGGGCSGTGACQVTMSQAQTVTATFELIQHDLTVLGNGTGSGGVTSSPTGINCTITAGTEGGDCSEIYNEGTQVTLTAQADANSTFEGWSGGGCSGTGTCQVAMSQAQTVTATFELIPQYDLTVAGAGTGDGGVTSNPSGIDCTISAGAPTGDCTESYDDNTPVTLTASASAGSTFQGWSGGGCSGTATCQVTMSQAQTVTATFELILHDLTVAGNGTGNGGVTSDPTGIDCTIAAGVASGDCSEAYIENQQVTLTAQADAGSTFEGWSGGGCSGTGTCQVMMSQAQTVTATFELILHDLTLLGSGTGNGGVTSDPTGIACTIAAGAVTGDCSETYSEGTQVNLNASANAGSTFQGWSGDGCSGTGLCQVTMSQAQTVTATFDLTPNPQFDLTVLGAGTGSGGVTSDPSGISCTIDGATASGDCSQTYDQNTLVTLTAQADAGSTFEGWTGGACSGTGTCQVTMSQAQTVTATFDLIPRYDLSVVGSGTGNGGVTSSPTGIGCTVTAGIASGDCSESYEENTQVTLTASADAGSTFEGWTGGGCTGTGTCLVTMSQAQTVTAMFDLIPRHDLTVIGSGTGSGGVTSNPTGIGCTVTAGVASGDCSESYEENTQVTLTASADAGSTFQGWTGGGCSGTGTCQVTMSQALAVTAAFELIPRHDLTILGSGTGNGGVTSNPAGINCTMTAGTPTGDCSETYEQDTQVTLTAQASAGSTFEGWSGGGCSGTGACQVTMSQVQTVTATFQLIPQYTLTVAGGGTGNGGVTSDLNGINCTITAGITTGDCTELYDESTLVTLTASADAGSTFEGWSGGGCTGTGTCQVTMTQAQTVTATFQLVLQLTVLGSGAGNGNVTSSPTGIDCTITAGTGTGDCSESYAPNTPVDLTAAADASSTFEGWSGGGCSGTGTCRVTMSQAQTVTATFELIPAFELTVVGSGSGSGTVTSNPTGISCSITAGGATGDCVELFGESTVVILTASANASSTFEGWSGGVCSGTGTCQVTMNQTQFVTALFSGGTVQVRATVETDPSHHAGDTADDMAIWIHPTDPSLSLVIGDDKEGGLMVWGMDGREVQYVDANNYNNVDLRYNFPLAGQFSGGATHQTVALVGVGDEGSAEIDFFKINPSTRRLEAAGSIDLGTSFVPYGSCMYYSTISRKYYYFVNNRDGDVQQWELTDDGSGGVTGTNVREFDVGSLVEGCVADDHLGHFYIGEEDVGIWKYGAEANAGTARTQVDETGSGGNLVADVEGLSLYYDGTGAGYLLASSQGEGRFVIYTREGDNAFVGKVQVVSNGGIDSVSGIDGLDVTNFPMGPGFTQGLFTVHDGDNAGASASNVKYVPWASIAAALGLSVNTTYDPRTVGQ